MESTHHGIDEARHHTGSFLLTFMSNSTDHQMSTDDEIPGRDAMNRLFTFTQAVPVPAQGLLYAEMSTTTSTTRTVRLVAGVTNPGPRLGLSNSVPSSSLTSIMEVDAATLPDDSNAHQRVTRSQDGWYEPTRRRTIEGVDEPNTPDAGALIQVSGSREMVLAGGSANNHGSAVKVVRLSSEDDQQRMRQLDQQLQALQRRRVQDAVGRPCILFGNNSNTLSATASRADETTRAGQNIYTKRSMSSYPTPNNN